MKKFFIILLIIILAISLTIGGLFLFRNKILTSIFEKTLTKINGAKVDIVQLRNPAFSTKIIWQNMKMTNPNKTMENSFETGISKFSLQFKPLLGGKIIIDEMSMNEFQTGTKRKFDGKILKKKKPDKKNSKLKKYIGNIVKEKIESEKKQIPIFNPKQLKTDIDVDKILADLNFTTPRKADSLKKIVISRKKYWEKQFKENSYEKDFNSIKNNAKKLSLKKIKSKRKKYDKLIKEIDKQLTAAKKIKKKSKKLNKSIKKEKNELLKDVKNLNNLSREIPVWVKKDYKNALNLAKLPDIDVGNVASMLFGEKISNVILNILEKAKKAREISQKTPTVKKEKFPELPKLWIKKIKFEGIIEEDLSISGEMKNISTDQDKTKKAMKLNFKGKLKNEMSISLSSVFDYRNGKNRETIKINSKNIPIKNIKLSNFALLPKKIKSGNGSAVLNIYMIEDNFHSQVGFTAEKIKFDLNSSSKKLNKKLKDVADQLANSINKIDLNAKISMKNKKFGFKISSNLDNLIGKKLKQIIDKEVGAAKKEIKRKVYAKLKRYEREIRVLADKETLKLKKEINNYLSKLNIEITELDKFEKEVKKLLSEEEDKVKDKLGDEVDKLKDKIKWP